jgi:Fe-S cluster biogenesis protein NfuA
MIRQIEKLFDEMVRPALAAHGGNIELIDIDNNKIFVKMSGGCQGCASSTATLKDGVERLVKQNYPEIEEIVDLTDHNSGDNPYYTEES